eukprot:GHVQ01015916.1.p1 GENE.GHVQ01015916.1~~GHVQ01015916.1.p1  ORF type:complete len:452 (+),score=43.99 GHVQ01015916.1:301-1656(+)
MASINDSQGFLQTSAQSTLQLTGSANLITNNLTVAAPSTLAYVTNDSVCFVDSVAGPSPDILVPRPPVDTLSLIPNAPSKAPIVGVTFLCLETNALHESASTAAHSRGLVTNEKRNFLVVISTLGTEIHLLGATKITRIAYINPPVPVLSTTQEVPPATPSVEHHHLGCTFVHLRPSDGAGAPIAYLCFGSTCGNVTVYATFFHGRDTVFTLCHDEQQNASLHEITCLCSLSGTQDTQRTSRPVENSASLVTGHSNGDVISWRISPHSGQCAQQRAVCKNEGNPVCAVKCCDALGYVVAAFGTGHLRIYDLRENLLKVEITAHARWIHGIDVTADGFIASVGEDGVLNIWNCHDSNKQVTLEKTFVVARKLLVGVSFIDNRSGASTSQDNTLHTFVTAYDSKCLYAYSFNQIQALPDYSHKRQTQLNHNQPLHRRDLSSRDSTLDSAQQAA